MKRAARAVAALALLAGCGGDGGGGGGGGGAPAAGASAAIPLIGQDGFTQVGTAIFTELGDSRVRVEIRLSNGGTGPQAAYVYKSKDCTTPTAEPAFDAGKLRGGVSTTELEGTDLETLTLNDYVIKIEESGSETATACGDLFPG